jgi:hypothetical protein
MDQKRVQLSKYHAKQLSVTWKQAVAFRLSRHHLMERAPAKNLVSVLGDMAGAQAQLFSAAQISLWSRVRDLQISHIEEALSKRTLVKASCMRCTLFLVPSEHLAVFALGAAWRGEKEIRWARGKGVPDRVIDVAISAALNVLDEPLTRTEIAERVSQALGVRKQSAQGSGWGSRRDVAAVPVGELTFPVVYLLQVAAARGVVCYGPHYGNEPTFVRANAWIPNWRDMSTEQAERILLCRYLQAYGPATPADFAVWSGASLTKARAIWAREQDRLAQVSIDSWEVSVLQSDLDELARAEIERPLIRLLPYFDTFLLGHKDRQHLVAVYLHSKIFRPQGWIAPVVLVDGRAAGVWKHSLEGNQLQVKVEPFGPLSRRIMAGIQDEAQDLGRVLKAPNVDVQIYDS